MPTITTNAKDLIARITKLSQLKQVRATVKAATEHVKRKAAIYPDAGNKPAKGWASQFWSDKQRKWFWANFRAGKLDLPYRRGQSPGSKRMGSKWTTRFRDAGLTGVVGNNVSYGILVQGEKQTQYHAKTGWKTMETVKEQERETVQEYILEGIRKAVAES